VVHHGDPVPHRHRLDLVVRDVDRRRFQAALQSQDLGARLDAQLRVEVRERFVHEERRGLADDRPAERNALTLTSGEGARLAIEQALEVEDLGCVLHAPFDVLLRRFHELEPECEVVEHRHVRVQRVGLEHHRDVPVLRRNTVDDARVDLDLSPRDLLEPGDTAERGRLPAPVAIRCRC
jgi:hypothetical protein